jgi:hypothetical protein
MSFSPHAGKPACASLGALRPGRYLATGTKE